MLDKYLVWDFKDDEFILNVKIPLKARHGFMNEDVNFLLKDSYWSIHKAFVWINDLFNFCVDEFVVLADLISSHVFSRIRQLLKLDGCELSNKIFKITFILIKDRTSITNRRYLLNNKFIINIHWSSSINQQFEKKIFIRFILLKNGDIRILFLNNHLIDFIIQFDLEVNVSVP